MNKIILSLASALLLSVTAVLPVSADSPSFVQVMDGVDGSKNTKLAAKENWKKYKGKEVSWSGVIHDVDSKGSKAAKVYVADKSRPLYKGYNMKLYTSDVEKALGFKKGQSISFKGTLDDYDTKDQGAVIEIKDVKF